MSLLKDVSALPAGQAPKQEPVAESKYGMIKEFNVQSALKTSDQSDAGKSDVVDKATAGGDVSFSLMRNTINSSGEVTGSDVADYIERAEELNDEVDTVPFGLETDDGQIVKVYVNAEQADAFEEAMKNMLGLEDDIEEAINRLTTEFDIVDVVWPKTDDDQDGDGEVDPDADLTIDDNIEDDDDFADGNYDVVGGGDTPEAEPASGKVKSTPDEEEQVEDDTGEDPPAEDEEDPEEDGEEEEEEDGDDTDPDKPKKKKKKAAPAEPATAAESRVNTGPLLNEVNKQSQENDMTVGSKFLNRVLAEAAPAEDRDGVKDGFNIPLDSQARAMAAKLKLPYAKRLVAFHFMCGVPGRYMNTADVTESIAGAADMLRKKIAVRRAFTTLYDALAAAKGFTIPSDGASVQEAKSDAKRIADQDAEEIIKVKAEIKKLRAQVADDPKAQKKLDAAKAKLAKLTEGAELTEAKAKRGGFIQKLLESVLVELGLPAALITTTGPSAVGTGVYRTAELIEQDSAMEKALRLLAARMGIKGNDAQEPIEEAVDVGNDEFAQAVTALVSALGIPDDVLERRRTQIVQALRAKKATLRNRGQILTMMGRLQDLISKGTIERGGQPEPDDNAAPVRESALQWKRLSALTEAPATEGSAEQAAKKVYARIKNERELTAKSVKALVKQYDDLTNGQDVAEVTSLVIDMLDEKGLLM